MNQYREMEKSLGLRKIDVNKVFIIIGIALSLLTITLKYYSDEQVVERMAVERLDETLGEGNYEFTGVYVGGKHFAWAFYEKPDKEELTFVDRYDYLDGNWFYEESDHYIKPSEERMEEVRKELDELNLDF